MKVIGLISGTSADAIDAALVEIQGAPPDLSVRLLAFLAVPFTASQRTSESLSLVAWMSPWSASRSSFCARRTTGSSER